MVESKWNSNSNDFWATTLAVGEDGEPDPYPEPYLISNPDPEPTYTTLAIGEEGDPNPGDYLDWGI